MRHQAQARFGLFGQARENHRDMIADVFAARAIHHHAGAVDFGRVVGRLQRNRHFHPAGKRGFTAKFNAPLVYDHRTRRKGEPRLPRFHCQVLLKGPGTSKFSRAHKTS